MFRRRLPADGSTRLGLVEGRRRGQELSCSFCGKTQKQSVKLIAGPGVYICDECIGLCVEIIAEETVAEVGQEAQAAARELRTNLDELRRLIRQTRSAPR